MKVMKQFGALAVLAMVGASALAASTGVPADAWSEPSEDQYGQVGISSTPEGATTVSFPARGAPPMPCVGTVVAEPGGLNEAFGGNYAASGVKSVKFVIASDSSKPSYAMVILRSSTSGRTWLNRHVSVTAGGTATNQISFQRSQGWETDYPGNQDSMWAADLESVDLIGISISQRGLAAQSYTISQFQLHDSEGAITPPAVLTPLEQALKDRFGVTSVDQLSEAQKAVDLDDDGMADVDEIRSEKEAGYANKIFVAELMADDGEGILVKWACLKNSTYDLYRAESLTSGFNVLASGTDLVAGETGFMTHRDFTATGQGPYFYKVHRK